MGKGKRLRDARAAEAEIVQIPEPLERPREPSEPTRARVIIRGGMFSNNGRHGINIGPGVVAEVDGTKTFGNGGHGINVE